MMRTLAAVMLARRAHGPVQIVRRFAFLSHRFPPVPRFFHTVARRSLVTARLAVMALALLAFWADMAAFFR